MTHLQVMAYVPIVIPEHQSFGALALPLPTVQQWLGYVLGVSDSDPDKPLSPLETTLLSDSAVTVIQGLSTGFEFELTARPPLTMANLNTPLEDTDEICCLTFAYHANEQGEDTSQSVTLLLPCAILAKTLKRVPKLLPPSKAELSQALHAHVEQVPMKVTAEFAVTSLSLEQAMGLSAGDVLLLGKELDDPMTLKIEDRVIFMGKPVQCEQNYGVMITQNA